MWRSAVNVEMSDDMDQCFSLKIFLVLHHRKPPLFRMELPKRSAEEERRKKRGRIKRCFQRFSKASGCLNIHGNCVILS